MYEMMDWWTGREGLSSLADFFEPILAAPTKVSDAKPPHPTPFCQQGKIGKGWGIQSRVACGEKC